MSFPSLSRGFDSPRPHSFLIHGLGFSATVERTYYGLKLKQPAPLFAVRMVPGWRHLALIDWRDDAVSLASTVRGADIMLP